MSGLIEQELTEETEKFFISVFSALSPVQTTHTMSGVTARTAAHKFPNPSQNSEPKTACKCGVTPEEMASHKSSRLSQNPQTNHARESAVAPAITAISA